VQVASIAFNRGTDVYDEAEPNSPYWTLVLVTYGKCVYWVGADKLILEKGELLLIPARTAYYTKGVPTMLHEKYAVKFTLDTEAPPLPIVRSEAYVTWRSGRWEMTAERLKSMHRHWQEQPRTIQSCARRC
jgi:AraC family transcriptional regulator of arabinose operon